MAISQEGERPYTREIHEARLARIQQILHFGLEFARGHNLTEEQQLTGELPDLSKIEVLDYPIQIGGKEYLRFFIIKWRDSKMSVQYEKNKWTRGITILDSTNWNEDGTTDWGHIQTVYTQESRDPDFKVDIEGMMESASSWRLEPRPETRL